MRLGLFQGNAGKGLSRIYSVSGGNEPKGLDDL